MIYRLKCTLEDIDHTPGGIHSSTDSYMIMIAIPIAENSFDLLFLTHHINLDDGSYLYVSDSGFAIAGMDIVYNAQYNILSTTDLRFCNDILYKFFDDGYPNNRTDSNVISILENRIKALENKMK